MKGVCLGRRFYQQMFVMVLFAPVFVCAGELYPGVARVVFQVAVMALFVGMVLYLSWRGWIEKCPSD